MRTTEKAALKRSRPEWGWAAGCLHHGHGSPLADPTAEPHCNPQWPLRSFYTRSNHSFRAHRKELSYPLLVLQPTDLFLFICTACACDCACELALRDVRRFQRLCCNGRENSIRPILAGVVRHCWILLLLKQGVTITDRRPSCGHLALGVGRVLRSTRRRDRRTTRRLSVGSFGEADGASGSTGVSA